MSDLQALWSYPGFFKNVPDGSNLVCCRKAQAFSRFGAAWNIMATVRM